MEDAIIKDQEFQYPSSLGPLHVGQSCLLWLSDFIFFATIRKYQFPGEDFLMRNTPTQWQQVSVLPFLLFS